MVVIGGSWLEVWVYFFNSFVYRSVSVFVGVSLCGLMFILRCSFGGFELGVVMFFVFFAVCRVVFMK